MQQDSFLRWPEVQATTSLSRTTVWRLEKANQFPKRRQIGIKAVAWLKSEVTAWVASKPVTAKGDK